MPSNFEFASLSRGDTGSWRDGVPSFQSLNVKSAQNFGHGKNCGLGSGVCQCPHGCHVSILGQLGNLELQCLPCDGQPDAQSATCDIQYSGNTGSNEALFCNCRHVTVPDPPSSWWVPCKFEWLFLNGTWSTQHLIEKPANSSVATKKPGLQLTDAKLAGVWEP